MSESADVIGTLRDQIQAGPVEIASVGLATLISDLKLQTARAQYYAASTARLRGELREAENLLNEARATFLLLESYDDAANAFRELAVIYMLFGQLEPAVDKLFEALGWHRQAEDKTGLTQTLALLAFALNHQNQETRASETHDSAIESLASVSDRDERIDALLQLTSYYLKAQRLDEAHARLIELQELLTTGHRDRLRHCQRYLYYAQLCETREDADGARCWLGLLTDQLQEFFSSAVSRQLVKEWQLTDMSARLGLDIPEFSEEDEVSAPPS